MGAKTKVDAIRYEKIKKELKSPKDDKKVMKKYHLGQTTVRAIRRSNSYINFKHKTSARPKKQITINSSLSSQEQAQKAWIGFLALCVLAAFAAAFILIRWVLSWFGV